MTLHDLFYPAIFLLGIIASIINVLAGGGSNLILPLLMVFGLDPQTANATNRIGIWFQNIAGTQGFYRKGKLPTHDLIGIFIPSLLGGIVGALLAAKLDVLLQLTPFTAKLNPNIIIKVILLGAMLSVAVLMLFKPKAVMYPPDVEIKVRENPRAFWLLFLSGMYGGFVQAGAGFVLLPALAGALHYDMVRANGLKLACTMVFTTVALAIFIWDGQVYWRVGFVLAAGNIVGALIGVRLAIQLRPNTIRWILFTMTLTAVIAALVF